ncbi:MAG: hypothetical protein AB1394_14725 [Bacteroidota bacterium]
MKNLFLLVLIVFLSSCVNDKKDNSLISSPTSILSKEIIESTPKDVEIYNKNIRHFFSFVSQDVINVTNSLNEITSPNIKHELYIDRENNIMNLSSNSSNKKVKIKAKFDRPSNSQYHLIGNGEIWIDEQQVVIIEEKFSNKKLEAVLSFPTLSGNNFIKILFNHNNKTINTESEFEINIDVKFGAYQKSFKNRINSTNNYELNDFVKEIKNVFPHYLFTGIDNSYYSTYAHLNNKWLKWESNVKLSHGFIVLDQDSKRLMKEPCYGNDDAWASTISGIVVGLFNPFAGIAYALIDTYIATNAKPC